MQVSDDRGAAAEAAGGDVAALGAAAAGKHPRDLAPRHPVHSTKLRLVHAGAAAEARLHLDDGRTSAGSALPSEHNPRQHQPRPPHPAAAECTAPRFAAAHPLSRRPQQGAALCRPPAHHRRAVRPGRPRTPESRSGTLTSKFKTRNLLRLREKSINTNKI